MGKTIKKIKPRNKIEISLQMGEHGAKPRTQVHADKRNKVSKKHPKKYLQEVLNGE